MISHSQFYKVLNKPWYYVPILIRAIRFSRARQRFHETAHIAWAHSLIGRPKVVEQRKNPFEGWKVDPIDGLLYPPASDNA